MSRLFAGVVFAALCGCDFGPTCRPGTICVGGVYDCGPHNCSGCCNSAGSCVPGTSDLTCGSGGAQCATCPTSEGCTGSMCVPMIDHCPPDAGVVTAAQVHSSVLGPRCGATCHAFGGSAGQYATMGSEVSTKGLARKASRYADDFERLKIVDPGRLRSSSLWLMVTATGPNGRDGPRGEKTGPSEPSDGTTLSEVERQQIRDWICAGAP